MYYANDLQSWVTYAATVEIELLWPNFDECRINVAELEDIEL